MRIVRLPRWILPRRMSLRRPLIGRPGPRRLTPSLRLLYWPAALLAAIVLFVVSGTVSTPTSGLPTAQWHRAGSPSGLPASAATLRYIFSEGLPTIGLARPTGGPISPGTVARLAAFLSYTLTGIAPLSPVTVLQSAFSGFGYVRGGPVQRGPSLGAWLAVVGAQRHARGVTAPTKAPSGLQVYGSGAPLVAIYATEGEGAFSGREPAPNAVPPTTTNRAEDVLGVAQALAKSLGQAGVPTVFANRFNDGEGELGAYLKSGALLSTILQDYRGLSLIIDVERPLVPPGTSAVRLSGQRVATVTLIVGTNARLSDPSWRQNLDLAKSLGAFFTRVAPGVFLGIQESPDRLNQELSPVALTLSLGGPSATPVEARAAVPYAVQAIIAYLSGETVPANP